MVKNNKKVKPSLLILLAVYFIVFSLWFLYRLFFRYPEEIDELVTKPVLWIAPVLIINYLKKYPHIPTGLPRELRNSLLLAVFIGFMLPFLQILPKLTHPQILIHRELNLIYFLIPLGTAVSEEYLFRGFFLRHLMSYFSPLVSNIIVSLFFAVIHLPLILLTNNFELTVIFSRLYLLTFSSFFFGFLYIRYKTIIPSVIAHFINNLILVLL